MNTSFVGGLIAGAIVGVAAALVVKRIKKRREGPTVAQTVNVAVIGTSPGANPESVQLNQGDSIQWLSATSAPFAVDFLQGSPFAASHFPGSGSPPSASSGPVSATANPGPAKCVCYKYRITVNNTPFDPHVIIMGN